MTTLEERAATDASIQAIEAFHAHFGEPASLAAIPNSRNHLFKVVGRNGMAYVVKIYVHTIGLIGNSEATAYTRLQGSGFVRRCYALQNGRMGTPAYAILDFVEGTTLLDSLERLARDPMLERRVIGQIVQFLRECAKIDVNGFGDLGLPSQHPVGAWDAFLDDYLARLGSKIENLPPQPLTPLLERGFSELRRFRAAEDAFLHSRPAAFVPIDLNMSNFLITPDGRLVVLDLESFWAADPLFALGEWAGHTFGTSRFEALMDAYGALTFPEMSAVRFYGLMSNMDVLLYIISNNAGEPTKARPWGNPHSFIELIDRHVDSLGWRNGP